MVLSNAYNPLSKDAIILKAGLENTATKKIIGRSSGCVMLRRSVYGVTTSGYDSRFAYGRTCPCPISVRVTLFTYWISVQSTIIFINVLYKYLSTMQIHTIRDGVL